MKDIIKSFQKELYLIENSLKRKRIVVAFGGFGEEREASIYTAEQVCIELLKHDFQILKIDPSNENMFKVLDPDKDIVFNCLHGDFGESGHISAILDYLKVPYTFSGLYPSAITMNKLYFSAVIKKLKLLSPQDNIDNHLILNLKTLIYKKICGGGSIGMHLGQKKQPRAGFFAQRFISGGKILTLGILEKEGKYIPLGIVEIKIKGRDFYDQKSKYENGFSSYIPYSGRNYNKIIQSGVKVFEFLGVKGIARIDFIEKEDKIYILEINSVPGLYENSNLSYSASLKGLSFYQLLIWILHKSHYQLLSMF